MEDFVGHVQRVTNGIAREVGKRVAASGGPAAGKIAEAETRQVLLEWFLGHFIPTDPRQQ